MKSAIVLSEVSHVAHIDALRESAGDAYDILAIGADVEYRLSEEGIAFISARDFRTTPTHERLVQVRQLGDRLVEEPRLDFLSHRGIAIAPLFYQALLGQLTRFFYYLDIAVTVAEDAAGYDHIIVLRSTSRERAGDPLFRQESANACADAFVLVCREKGVDCIEVRASADNTQKVPTHRKILFALKRVAYDVLFFALNTVVALVVPQRRIRVLGSEYWKHVASWLPALPDAELVLVDREQAIYAGIRAILRHRIRFAHGESYLGIRARARMRGIHQGFVTEWGKRRTAFGEMEGARFRGYALDAYLAALLDRIVRIGSKEALLRIEGTRLLLEHWRPDIVIVRASTSAQIHFGVLCATAKQLGIPSLELQHGIFGFGSESQISHRYAEYIAEYGPLDRERLRAIGYTDEHLFDVGSPRFDVYTKARMTTSSRSDNKFHVIVIAPEVSSGYWTDSYDVADWFAAIGEALRGIPNIFVTIKLRPVDVRAHFFDVSVESAFQDIPHEVKRHEPLPGMLGSMDLVISYFSTVVLEAFLAGVPLVHAALLPMYAYLDEQYFMEYSRAATTLTAASSIELADVVRSFAENSERRKQQIAHANQFIHSAYTFDGHDAERLADVVRKLAERKTAVAG